MKITKSIIIAFTIIGGFTIYGCKKEKDEPETVATPVTTVTTANVISKLTNDTSKTWSRTIVGAVGTGLETWFFNANGALTMEVTSTNGGPTLSPTAYSWSLFGTIDQLTASGPTTNVYTIDFISATSLRMTASSNEIIILTSP